MNIPEEPMTDPTPGAGGGRTRRVPAMSERTERGEGRDRMPADGTA